MDKIVATTAEVYLAIGDAMTMGLPGPRTVNIHTGCVYLRFATIADADAWARHLGASPTAPRRNGDYLWSEYDGRLSALGGWKVAIQTWEDPAAARWVFTCTDEPTVVSKRYPTETAARDSLDVHAEGCPGSHAVKLVSGEPVGSTR